jgi:hypothetical protein
MSGTSDGFGNFTTVTEEDPFEFKTVYDTSWGASSGYWSSGWAFSNQTSDTMTNQNGQHSSYAGGAADGSQYAIGKQKSIISKTDANAHFESIKITNSNYAAHSMLNGDMFAKQFGGATGDDPDWFLLTIVGYDAQDGRIDSVEFYLADYRFTDNSQDYIVKAWTTVDISSLSAAAYIEFKLSSSDTGTWGMNTPSFYAIDQVTHQSSASVEENDHLISMYPNPTTGILNLTHASEYKNFQVISADGRLVKSGSTQLQTIDLSDLPNGSYYIRLVGSNDVVTRSVLKL